ncbi:MAG: nucleoside triphosphate pyrophosphohydrolase [Candidatus Dormibacteria bacterium]
MRDQAAQSLRNLIEVVDRLRAPGGCPWDHEQTHRSLRPYLLEETYELLEAIDQGGSALLREELGDVLLQVLMHAAIAAGSGEPFDIGDVAETTRLKMIHRHPHVFGDLRVEGAADVVVNWERLKRTEKGERLSVLDGVPHALPALAHAQGVQKRPARLGFDESPTAESALAWIDAALRRLREVMPSALPAPRGADWTATEGERRSAPTSRGHAPPPPQPAREIEAAVGDLLFAMVALSRRLRVNPEDALRGRSEDFAARFRALEQQARADATDLHDLSAEEWRRRWDATKHEEVMEPR